MAVLIHMASKNSDYGDAIRYLLFQHDEKNGKPVLDEQGRMVLREEFFMDGILCEPMAFDQECEKLNAFYNKNKRYDEIKTHHYIISYDPEDVTECGLTGEKAQQLSLEFARKYLPGHQALVVTHTDGQNHSGNIHTHIVINSVRKLDIPEEDFMDQPSDHKAGCKHHRTKAYARYLREKLMEMCESNGLHQVDLMKPAERKITQKEYRSSVRGQDELQKLNQEIIADGLTPASTVFRTWKQKLRDAIDDAAQNAGDFEMFQTLLYEKYGIDVEEKRGRFGYHIPGREKNVTERALGTNYGKRYLMGKFKENRDYHKDPFAIFIYPSDLQLVASLQDCVKAQQNKAYARKVKISNLQKMADTLIFLQEHQYGNLDQLSAAASSFGRKKENISKELESIKQELTDTNSQIHFAGQYLSNRKVYQDMLNSRWKGSFRKKHEKEISAFEEARNFFRDRFPGAPIPSMKALKEKKQELTKNRDHLKDELKDITQKERKIKTIVSNVNAIFDGTIYQEKKPSRKGPEL